MTTVLVKKYNPLEMSEEDVLALATGREKLLDIMLSEMKVCLKKGSNQHFVLHGPRGIGKSFFTRLLKIHHDQSDDFKNSLFLQLPEEQENINFAADLMDVIATLLEGGKLIDTAPKWTISDIQWQKSKQRLKEAINDIKKNGKLHVFVTQENLQAFIPKLDKIESSRLREFLSDFDEVTIIGSSLRPDLDNDYSKRLFQVFKKLDIEPWTANDFLIYYDKLAQRSNYDKEQLDNLKKSKNKIKAISQFTGGSPRLAVILSKLILEKNILDTAQLLDGIIDELTTYYQDITNDIPSKSKILFDMLIRKGENMTQSTLAAAFEPPLEQKDIARSFSWLTDNYYVVSSKQARGNTKYFYVRDRLYVLYYQKRMVYADVPFSFVGVFVDFLNVFYTQKEWVKELECLDLDHTYALPVLSVLAEKEGLYLKSSMDSEDIQKSLIMKYSEKATKKPLTKQTNREDIEKDDFDLGNAYAQKGDYENAIIYYKKVIELNPKFINAYNNLGIAYFKIRDLQNAILIFEKAINIDPNYIGLYNNLGNTYIEIGDLKKAILLFNNGINISPNDSTLHYNLAIAYEDNGEIENAISSYKTTISLDPNYAKAYNNLGSLYFSIGEIEKAIYSLEKANNLDPNDSKALFNLGNAYKLKGDIKNAINSLENAIKLDQNYLKAYINLGNIYRDQRKTENAISCYEKAIIIDPKYAIAYNNLGGSYGVMGEFDKAINYYKIAISLDNKYSNAYYNLGYTYDYTGDHEKSLSIFIEGLSVAIGDIKFLRKGLQIIINYQQWSYLIQFHDQWKGNTPFSSILGESLFRVIEENPDNKFFHFKNTFDAIRNFSFININEVINGLCIGLYKDGDMDFLRQIVDELSHDFVDDAFVQINLEVYKYLLNPGEKDINQLHPDVRTVVNSIIKEE